MKTQLEKTLEEFDKKFGFDGSEDGKGLHETLWSDNCLYYFDELKNFIRDSHIKEWEEAIKDIDRMEINIEKPKHESQEVIYSIKKELTDEITIQVKKYLKKEIQEKITNAKE
jgi:hypothetical protein